MLYLFDEDNYNAIERLYKCEFIYQTGYSAIIKHYKNENEIEIVPENIQEDDIVCYHNSFPNEENKILTKIRFLNEEKQLFTTICFSGDSAFYRAQSDGKDFKIHKDKFYMNLKVFTDSGFKIDSLLFGESAVKTESRIIIDRMTIMLFEYDSDGFLDLKSIKPADLKRLCELANYNYDSLLKKIDDITVGAFRDIISNLEKSM